MSAIKICTNLKSLLAGSSTVTNSKGTIIYIMCCEVEVYELQVSQNSSYISAFCKRLLSWLSFLTSKKSYLSFPLSLVIYQCPLSNDGYSTPVPSTAPILPPSPVQLLFHLRSAQLNSAYSYILVSSGTTSVPAIAFFINKHSFS